MSALISALLHAVDRRDWPALGDLVTPDVVYDRPGYPTIRGVDEWLTFYRMTRIVATGQHRLVRVLADDAQGFCWGEFTGTTRGGQPVDVRFADWYAFRDGRVCQRRTFFYEPAI
ncbi:hypothetical protein DFJ67_5155 [Asanoa ferruginea]|uniref:SnoaL-like domain-containing protein n=1 Tax=Asanoa ferruginea TaxID=53367 RepID=A0A3D9ZP26_9ACTN|nr:nuclear transport factor 2 family protein [Asanoa ferruginea]REF99128.1 hypothetical protein DFJ67_5155 [Asanoa ferruginea]GIF51427.1 hypothetical protein Afe04nite_59660 [Asanoa ferruginea]